MILLPVLSFGKADPFAVLFWGVVAGGEILPRINPTTCPRLAARHPELYFKEARKRSRSSNLAHDKWSVATLRTRDLYCTP